MTGNASASHFAAPLSCRERLVPRSAGIVGPQGWEQSCSVLYGRSTTAGKRLEGGTLPGFYEAPNASR